MVARETASKKATRETIRNSRELKKYHDKLYNAANHAPMFCKELEKKGKDGRSARRCQRAIGGHAWGIAASGAAGALVHELKADLDAAGIGYDSTTSAPCLPAFAKGSKFVLEQFMAAYVQEGIAAALAIMKTCTSRKRLNAKITDAAFKEVNASIFAASTPAPRAVVVVPLKKKAAKKKEEEDDTLEAGEEDDAADEAAVAAADQ